MRSARGRIEVTDRGFPAPENSRSGGPNPFRRLAAGVVACAVMVLVGGCQIPSTAAPAASPTATVASPTAAVATPLLSAGTPVPPIQTVGSSTPSIMISTTPAPFTPALPLNPPPSPTPPTQPPQGGAPGGAGNNAVQGQPTPTPTPVGPSTVPTIQGSSGYLVGRLTIGPLSPIQIGPASPTPPAQLCAAQGLIVYAASTNAEAARTQVRPDCTYRIALGPGAYVVRVQPSPLVGNRILAQPATIQAGQTVQLDFRIDTGLR